MFRGRIKVTLIIAILVIASVAGFLGSYRPAPATGQRAGVAFAAPGAEAPPAPQSALGGAAPAAKNVGHGGSESDLTTKARKMPHGPDVYKTHASQTPSDLQHFDTDGVDGIRYSGAESDVAKKTEQIRSIDFTKAAKTKYDKAEKFLTPNKYKRDDPLEPTDALPSDLRAKLFGAGLLNSLSDADLEDLLLANFRSQLQYFIDVQVIGVIDNGVTKQALIQLFGGQKRMVKEGDSLTLFRAPYDPKNYRKLLTVSLSVVEIREDLVKMQITMSAIRDNGTTEDFDPVPKNFYIRNSY